MSSQPILTARARSLPTNAGQQPSNYPLVRIAPAALKLTLLDGTLSKRSGLLCRMSLVLWKCHPLANDLPAHLVVFHFPQSLGLGNPPPRSAARRHLGPHAILVAFLTAFYRGSDRANTARRRIQKFLIGSRRASPSHSRRVEYRRAALGFPQGAANELAFRRAPGSLASRLAQAANGPPLAPARLIG